MPEDAFDASWQPTPDPRDIIIPGVDPELPITVQTEQIDQLITLKLQNIDKNFAKCHQIITTKILPALKKYSAGSQPTRDAAKFWRGFFEAAAQIRVSVDEDGVSTLGERTPNDASYEANRTPQQGPTYHDDTTDGSDLTFRRGAVSSTPQVQKFSHVVDSVDHSVDTNDSWVARSVESPIVRIDRELKDLAFDDEQDTQSSVQHAAPIAPAPRTGKPLPIPLFESEESGSSMQNISVHQPSSSSSTSGILFAVPEPSPQSSGSSSSSNKGKGRRKSAARDLRQGVLKSNLMNTTKPGVRWDGITDLRNTTSSTADPTVSTVSDMSFGDATQKPRVPLQPYSPSRTRETLQRTPSKQAAALFVRNVLSKMPSGSDHGLVPADTSVVSSVAPSTSYSVRNYGGAHSSTGSASILEKRPNPIHGLFGLSPDDLQGSALGGQTSKPPPTETHNARLTGPSRQAYVEDSPMKWQDDSGLVSPAPYMPRGEDIGEDDSYDRSRSTDSSFDNDETRYGAGGAEDQSQWLEKDRGDGYSSGSQGPEDEETVFGARQAAPVPAGPASRHRFSNMFALPDVSATYHGGRLEDAGVGEESPTPWMRTGAGRGR
ncbi:DASH complex subunit ASK1 [Ceratobasidium sp. AG-Ba]|nr:DASH complex subunit ASK1 [Ceratobasidium sp. AG-Ba]